MLVDTVGTLRRAAGSRRTPRGSTSRRRPRGAPSGSRENSRLRTLLRRGARRHRHRAHGEPSCARVEELWCANATVGLVLAVQGLGAAAIQLAGSEGQGALPAALGERRVDLEPKH